MAEQDRKRTGSGGNALPALLSTGKVVLALVTVLVVAVLGWIAWWTYRPDLFISPIDRFTHWRHLTSQGTASMIPDVFEKGESGAAVIQQLLNVGYYWNGSQDGEEFYRKSGRSPALFCASDYYVIIQLDEAGGLATATSSVGWFCL